jgi:hypothetical protein
MSKSYPDTGFGWQGTDAKIVLPRLSDETVIAVHDLIHQLIDSFEACYGQQIDSFYQALHEDSKDNALDVGCDWPL